MLTAFTLRIGGYEYAGRDSLIGRSRWKGNYWWGDREFSWTPGENVEVSLSMDRPALPSREHAPPSAYFSKLPPDGHNGVDSFLLRLNFTKSVEINDANLKDHALVVNGGFVSEVEVLTGGRIWLITVEPDSVDDVTVSLHDATSCQDRGAVCYVDGNSLHYYPTLTVPGPGANPWQREGLMEPAGGIGFRSPVHRLRRWWLNGRDRNARGAAFMEAQTRRPNNDKG